MGEATYSLKEMEVKELCHHRKCPLWADTALQWVWKQVGPAGQMANSTDLGISKMLCGQRH